MGRPSTTPIQKVLMIDPSVESHAALAQHLAGESVELFFSLDAASGLQQVEEIQPDLILLDVESPAVNGFEICRRLKEEVANIVVPVIFLAAAPTREQKILGLNLGGADFVIKPFDPEELLARVRASLRIKMLLDLLSTQAMLDGLTGLWNRVYLEERLTTEMARCKRSKAQLAVILLDVDHFKAINDRFGHPFGDHVLQEVAGVLAGNCRVEDCACRYGGEEFAFIAVGAGPETAMLMAERLRASVEAIAFSNRGISLSVTCSFGVAPAAGDVQSTIDSADRALYQAKQNGRNRVVAA